MKIKKVQGTIQAIHELSSTAREVHISLDETLDIVAGCFVNIFITIDGEVHRRAYSIASDCDTKKEIQLAIRRKEGGTVSSQFWARDIIGTRLQIMGPLGLNTVDKMQSERVFLIGYGIGVSVIKSLMHAIIKNPNIKEIHIIMGCKDEGEMLYKDFFTQHESADSRVTTRFVLSKSNDKSYPYIGFAQEYISDYNFNNADVYICGQTIACNSAKSAILAQSNGGDSIQFFIEDFH